MKNKVITLLFSLTSLLLNAADIYESTPSTDPGLPKTVDLWIHGVEGATHNMNTEKVADSFSGGIIRFFNTAPESGEFSVTYKFEVPTAGEYDFYAAIITQGVDYSSPVEFKFDNADWKPAPATPKNNKTWGISRAMTWSPLGTVKLAAGAHTLSMRITERARMGRWSFMCDGVAAFKNEPAPLAAAVIPQPVLNVTPAKMPGLPQSANIWIEGGKPEKSNMTRQRNQNSFSGDLLYFLNRNPESNNYFATYRFDVKQAGTYVFFAALITQGKDYCSPVEFRFDHRDFATVRPNSVARTGWGISNAVTWDFLSEIQLEAGSHTVELRFRRPGKNANWSFMCDGILGFRKEEWKNGNFTPIALPEVLTPDSQVACEFSYSGKPFPAELRLVFSSGETALSRAFICAPGTNKTSFAIPGVLGSGRYRAELVPMDSPDKVLTASAYGVVPRQVPPLPAKLADVRLDGGMYELKFADGGKPATVAAQFFHDDKLYGVALLKSKKGPLPETVTALLKGREMTVKFTPVPAVVGNIVTKAAKLAGTPEKLPKPMNYGTFIDRDKIGHFWYMNHDSAYIFDGAPYFPVGGMWTPNTLFHPDSDPEFIAKNVAYDLNVLSKIKAAGLNDFYFNLSTRPPLWVRQHFIDLMEKEGVRYGYQIGAGNGAPIPAFFITRDWTDAPKNFRRLTKGKYADGKITARFPMEQKLAGLLIVDPENPDAGAEFITFSDKVGKDTRQHIVDFEVQQDFGKLREIAFPVKKSYDPSRELVLIPLLEAKMHHVEVWDDAELEALKQRLAWLGKVEWNANLRCFVDPLRNETHMTNGTENLRQYTAAFNTVYAGYLKKVYGSLENLSKEWGFNPGSFENASRLIPFRWQEHYYWIDPESGKIHTGKADSFAWIDYQEGVRVTYSERADQIALYIKSLVDIPVVLKTVNGIGETMSISRTYRGYDGIGFENYLNQGIPGATSGGAARAQVDAAPHTMWKVGTEIGQSAAAGNDNTKFFVDEAEIRRMSSYMAKLGVNGFYYFGLDLKPASAWKNHNFHNFPEGLAWAAKIKKDYADSETKPAVATPRNYKIPGGYNWWWWTTRYKALFDYEPSMLSQSVRLNHDEQEWFCAVNVLPDEFDAVVINCPYPPFSRYYRNDIERALKSGKTVYYVGDRIDLGAIPELDQYFGTREIQFPDNSVARELKMVNDAKVLASEEGVPWALQIGKTTIVSRVPGRETGKNTAEYMKYLRQIVVLPEN